MKEIFCTYCDKNIKEEEIIENFKALGLENEVLDHLNKSSEPFIASMSFLWPKKVLKTSVSKDMKCVNCKLLIKNIKLDISAAGDFFCKKY